jgi:hypothetical protein
MALHSAYLGASGSIWKDQCGFSDLLSCLVMTSKPFYIFLMYRPLFTTQDEWTIIRYVMDVLRPFGYLTRWILKRHMVTWHYDSTVYNDMFDHIDGIIEALVKMMTEWRQDLLFVMKFARQKLSKSFFEVTPTTSLHLISAHTLNSFPKLRSFRKWEKARDINPDEETPDSRQYQKVFLKYVENEYCTKHQRLTVNKLERVANNNPFCKMASGSGQSSFDPYDLSSDDDAYLMPRNVAEMTRRYSDRTACLLTAARL